ncbi:MAG: flavodoxin family protein [Lachnospiraceae bacterium]
MNVTVRYQSRGGNTKAVAEIIAKKAGVKAESVAVPVEEEADLLFVGGGVYMGKIDDSLAQFLEELDANKVGQIICFSTTGMQESAIVQISEAARKKGIRVNENSLLIRMLWRGHAYLGMTGGKLTEKQIAKTKTFVDEVLRL